MTLELIPPSRSSSAFTVFPCLGVSDLPFRLDARGVGVVPRMRVRNTRFDNFYKLNVGMTGVEPATPAPPVRCANQTAPHPDIRTFTERKLNS